MLQLAKGVCSQESTASGDRVVLFVDDETFSYNFHLSCMLSSWNSIFPWKVLKFLCKTLKAHPQEHKYFTHYSWLPDLNGATVLGKPGLLSGYHQMLLHPSYTKIRTLSTHPWGLSIQNLNSAIPKTEFPSQHCHRNLSTHNPDHESKSQQLSERGKRQGRGCWWHGISVHRINPGVKRNKLVTSCK